jgi:hypothetical protein
MAKDFIPQGDINAFLSGKVDHFAIPVPEKNEQQLDGEPKLLSPEEVKKIVEPTVVYKDITFKFDLKPSIDSSLSFMISSNSLINRQIADSLTTVPLQEWFVADESKEKKLIDFHEKLKNGTPDEVKLAEEMYHLEQMIIDFKEKQRDKSAHTELSPNERASMELSTGLQEERVNEQREKVGELFKRVTGMSEFTQKAVDSYLHLPGNESKKDEYSKVLSEVLRFAAYDANYLEISSTSMFLTEAREEDVRFGYENIVDKIKTLQQGEGSGTATEKDFKERTKLESFKKALEEKFPYITKASIPQLTVGLGTQYVGANGLPSSPASNPISYASVHSPYIDFDEPDKKTDTVSPVTTVQAPPAQENNSDSKDAEAEQESKKIELEKTQHAVRTGSVQVGLLKKFGTMAGKALSRVRGKTKSEPEKIEPHLDKAISAGDTTISTPEPDPATSEKMKRVKNALLRIKENLTPKNLLEEYYKLPAKNRFYIGLALTAAGFGVALTGSGVAVGAVGVAKVLARIGGAYVAGKGAEQAMLNSRFAGNETATKVVKYSAMIAAFAAGSIADIMKISDWLGGVDFGGVPPTSGSMTGGGVVAPTIIPAPEIATAGTVESLAGGELIGEPDGSEIAAPENPSNLAAEPTKADVNAFDKEMKSARETLHHLVSEPKGSEAFVGAIDSNLVSEPTLKDVAIASMPSEVQEGWTTVGEAPLDTPTAENMGEFPVTEPATDAAAGIGTESTAHSGEWTTIGESPTETTQAETPSSAETSPIADKEMPSREVLEEVPVNQGEWTTIGDGAATPEAAPGIHLERNFFGNIFEYDVPVQEGDTLSGVMMKSLPEYGDFSQLAEQNQQIFVDNVVNNLSPDQLKEVGISSGDINRMKPGETIDMKNLYNIGKTMKVNFKGIKMTPMDIAKLIQ